MQRTTFVGKRQGTGALQKLRQLQRYRTRASVLECAAAAALCVTLAFDALAAEKSTESDGSKTSHTAESLVTLARPSVVVISHRGRDGKEEGLGAGVIVSSNGLIATCLHVIGEGRPVSIRLEDGARHDAAEIHAWDRKLDLAVLRIEANDLPALPLGDSNSLKQGAPLVAIGNPLGLEHSIVQGVLSAKRELDGVEMLQLAIPVEPGNSGGPVLDLNGKIQGLVTMKSALSANLGFAVPASALQALLDKPNPVSMDRWLKLTSLNTNEWTPLLGARWSQKAGRIHVEGAGSGFGGRSICLSRRAVPDSPYELSVSTRLDDESGAAGLIFEADGDDRHYGFYPTGGQLRLTRFEGPSVFTWTILQTVPSPHYRAGDWNDLRVRVEPDKLQCFVNGALVIESDDTAFRGGKAGLAKFRHTKAAFRNFVIGTNLSAQTRQETAALGRQLQKAKTDAELIAALKPHGPESYALLRQRSRELDREAQRLRKLARTLHEEGVVAELQKALDQPDDQIDLLHAALLVSRLDNPDLEIAAYLEQFDVMARELKIAIPSNASDDKKLSALNDFLFRQHAFHGSRSDYYNPANSYIDQVLDDREGIPITLSVLFMQLGARVGLEIVGIPLPGHFVVQHRAQDGAKQIVDVFDGGKILLPEEAARIVRENGGTALREEHLQPARKREIIVRMLRNLLRASQSTDATVLHYLDAILAIAPDEAFERFERARLRLSAGNVAGAREDLSWLLEKEPPGLDLEAIRQLYRSL